VKDIEKCINCGWCEIRCPDFAITVEQKNEGEKSVEKKGEEATPERGLAAGQ
jgi:ferredoxin